MKAYTIAGHLALGSVIHEVDDHSVIRPLLDDETSLKLFGHAAVGQIHCVEIDVEHTAWVLAMLQIARQMCVDQSLQLLEQFGLLVAVYDKESLDFVHVRDR